MQIGLSTYSFPWAFGVNGFDPPQKFSGTQLLEYAAEQNISIVQFGDNYPLHELPADKLSFLLHTADKLNIQIEVGTKRLSVENVRTYISIATKLRTNFVRIVIDDDKYHPDKKEVIDIILEILPLLKQSKIKLAIENHDRFPARVLKEIIESTDRNWIGICLDTANSIAAGEGFNEVIAVLAPFAINLHIKDITIKRVGHKMGFRVGGCTAGTGLIQIPQVIAEIEKYNRCQSAILELWSDPEPTILETVTKEQEAVARSLQYLKTIIT